MSDRREIILGAAKQLFHQYGPQKTTIGDIAKAAGVGVGSVYLEFEGKDAILLHLSKDGHRAVLSAAERAWRRKGKPVARLQAALEARMEAFLEVSRLGVHGVDLVRCGGCAPVKKAHDAFREAEHKLFATFLSEGASDGAFVAHDFPTGARALLLAYSAFGPPEIFNATEEQLRTDIAAVHALVFPGLLPR